MSKKKKIFLLSDDIRQHSGIATMAREIVMGCCHKYDFANLAGSVKHPEKGKVIDLSEAAQKETGVKDAYVRLYPTDGYGNPDILMNVINIEKPDVIMHFTDPRFWTWLYQMERDLRQTIPLTYLNIWDDVPFPMWNRPFYMSCDALFSISKQTLNINAGVIGEDLCVGIDDVSSKKDLKGKHLLHYVPHGIHEERFRPLETEAEKKELSTFSNALFGGKKYDYILFYNNRNISRKRTSNIILAYRMFCDSLPKEEAKKCCLLMHTAPSEGSGTDLTAVVEALCPYDVKFSTNKLSPDDMNKLYNIADVVVNMASNEGFGLSHAEGLMTGTPIINTVTGGLQDGCFFHDDDGNAVVFNNNWGSNHDGKFKNHGVWAQPLYPAMRNLQGSPPTPYIFDDMAKWEDMAHAMMFWYKVPSDLRKKAGIKGREFALGEAGMSAKNMCDQLIIGMETTLNNWSPRPKFSLHTTDEYYGHKSPDGGLGFEIPNIDQSIIEEKMEEFMNKIEKE
jgi:glycosyltransferase involved in cell wall biosynthesis